MWDGLKRILWRSGSNEEIWVWGWWDQNSGFGFEWQDGLVYILTFNLCSFSNSFDCSHFGLDEPQFSVAEELKEDFKQHEAMWTLYEEFSNGLKVLEDTEWIVFR